MWTVVRQRCSNKDGLRPEFISMNTAEVSNSNVERQTYERNLPVGAVCSVQPAGSNGAAAAGL